MSKTNYLVPLLRKYLGYYGIYPAIMQIQLTLESAPSFPSLLSLQQTCTYLGLNVKACKADFSALYKINKPAIVHWKNQHEEKFVLVIKVTPGKVSFFDAAKHRIITLLKDEFCTFWTGALLVSENELKSNPIRKSRLPKIEYSLALMAIFIFTFVLGYSSHDKKSLFFVLGLFLVKATGVWLTANIIKHEASTIYSSFDTFCNKRASFDCNKVFNSHASKIFNISLADIGLIYFFTGLFVIILSLFTGSQKSSIIFLFFVSLSGLPFVLFSIFYQKFNVKKWCPLCLGVVGLVVLENLLFLLYPEKAIPKTSFLFVGIMLVASINFSFLIVHFIKKLIKAQEDAFASKSKNLQLKRNPTVLFSLFNRQKRIEIPQKNAIIIGNQVSNIVITTLLSPLCKPCKRMANEMLQLLEKHPESFLWQIRFDGIEKNVYDPINSIQLHIKQLCDNEKDNNAKIQIIKDWFSRQSFQWFAAKYPIDKTTPETIDAFAEQINENAKLNVNRVPVLWINNRIMPHEYSVTDIPLLCTDINLLLQLTK